MTMLWDIMSRMVKVPPRGGAKGLFGVNKVRIDRPGFCGRSGKHESYDNSPNSANSITDLSFAPLILSRFDLF